MLLRSPDVALRLDEQVQIATSQSSPERQRARTCRGTIRPAPTIFLGALVSALLLSSLATSGPWNRPVTTWLTAARTAWRRMSRALGR